MTTIHPESTEDFEFIQTPEAPQQTKPDFDCGVPTTLVGSYVARKHLEYTCS
jgi:cyclopropane-fatty-acyl-phospholipid synthase